MPLMYKQVSVPAGGSATPLVGDQFEFVGRPSFVEFGIVAEATGVLATIFSGADLLQQEGPVNIRAAGVPPTYPDDFLLNDVAGGGDRLSVQLRNTAGAAIIVRISVRITPL